MKTKSIFGFKPFVYCAFLCAIHLTACLNDAGEGRFLNTKTLALDATNDRLFVLEADQNVFFRTASLNSSLGEKQPAIDPDRALDDDLLALMPHLTTNAVAYPQSTATHLFLFGATQDDVGVTSFNQVSVLVFDDLEFSLEDSLVFELDDDNIATDDSSMIISAVLADPDNEQIFVADFSSAQIFVIDPETHLNKVPVIAVAAEPRAFAKDDEYLYVCHSDETLTDHLTLIDLTDYTQQTTALGFGCMNLAVHSTDAGVLLLAQKSEVPEIEILNLDLTDLSVEAIPTAEEGFTDGRLVSGFGLTSVIGAMQTSSDDDNIYAYLAEQDGNIQMLTFESDLSSWTHQGFFTSALNYSFGDVFQSESNVHRAYFTAEAGFLLSIKNTLGEIDLDLDS